MMKFLSSEVFPTQDSLNDEIDHASIDVGSETTEKAEGGLEDDFADSEKNDDVEESSNYFELLHSNLAPSRRLKPMFFDAEILVITSHSYVH